VNGSDKRSHDTRRSEQEKVSSRNSETIMGLIERCFLLATLVVTTVRCLAPNQPMRSAHKMKALKYQVLVPKVEYQDVSHKLDGNEEEELPSGEEPYDWLSAEAGDGVEMNYAWDEDDEILETGEEEEQNEEYDDTNEEGSEAEYEDDSVYPTFDLLKEWTVEYTELIDLAGGGMTRVSVGMQHTMHDAFVFTSPKIGPIGKGDFVKLMEYYNDNGLDLASAVPDLSVSYEGWHQDPDDPWR
jgi:hypothetical protein